MKIHLFIQIALLLVLPFAGKAQEIQEGGESIVTKEQARLFQDKKKTESLFFDANKAKVTENPGEAMHLFKQVVELDPTHDAAWYELGLLYYQQRDIKNSISNLAKAYELDPNNVWYCITLATVYTQNSQFNEARSIYELLHQKHPSDRSYALELANTWIKLDKPQEAIKIYDDIEAKQGISEEISLRKHQIYLATGKKKKALEEIEKLATANEWDSRIQSLLAEFYITNGMQDKALNTYEKILTIDPENPYINISLADFYRKQGDLKKSILALKKGFANQYLDAGTKMQILGTYYSQTGNYEGMDKDILELSAILADQHPYDPQVLAFRAEMLATIQEYQPALDLFKKVSELDPGKYEVWENIMRINALMNNYDSLVIESNRVIELFPVQPMPYYFNAIANMMLKNYDNAITSLNTGIKLVFNNNQLMAEFYSLFGDAFHGANRIQEAFNAYENSIKYDPKNAVVLNNYAYYLALENKDLDKAVSLIQKANELSPDISTYLDTYAWVLYKKGDFTNALVYMEKALQLEVQPDAVELEHYGDILYRLNRVDEAKQWWEKAAALGEGSKFLPAKVKDGKLYE